MHLTLLNQSTIYRSDMKTLIHIILIVSAHPDQQVLFHTPVIVKKTPHVSIFECWGVKIHEGVWLMDEQGNWHELEETDDSAKLVSNSIYQRLRIMQFKRVA